MFRIINPKFISFLIWIILEGIISLLAICHRHLSTFGREYSSGATFKQGTESYDIMIKYADESGEIKKNPDKTIDDLKHLEVTGTGGSVMEMEELSNIIFSIGHGQYSQGEPGKEDNRNL